MSIPSETSFNTLVANPPVALAVSPRSDEGRHLREPLRVLLCALALGGAADLLFRGGTIALGINVPIFVLLFVGVLTFLGRREGTTPRRNAALLFLLPALFFAGMIAVRANAMLTFYNGSACAALLLFYLRFYAGGDPLALSVGACLGEPWKSLGRVLAAPFAQRESFARITAGGEHTPHRAALGRGLLLALPLVALFGWLLMNADGLFATAINNAMAWLLPTDLCERIGRAAIALSVAFLCLGAVAYAVTRREKAASESAVAVRRGWLGAIEATVVLGSLLTLFTAFLVTQTGYLFGGDAHVRAVSDLTYAEYARHGFAELNVVAVLTLLLISGLKRVTRRESAGEEARFAGLATALLVLTLPLLASSISRMQAYEVAYGATELRLYVDLFIVWLGVGLVWFGTTLWQRRVTGGLGLYVCAVGFLVSLNVINPDATIARRNIARYAATNLIDSEYLDELSDDALPELVRQRDQATDPTVRQIVEDTLRESSTTTEPRDWQAWNLARARARQLRARCRITTP